LEEIGSDFENGEHSIEANYSVGLGHVLSGIMAHLSSSVISATLVWHLVVEGSRFRFSHEFSQILLSQFESRLIGEDIQFKFRRKKQRKLDGSIVTLFNVYYRPENEEFENMSVWHFF
jgi:hypothetical protein